MAKSAKPAVVMGDFANYKPILGRKVLSLIIEVPIERAPEVFAALGYPTGGDSIPVAVARLDASASMTQPAPGFDKEAMERERGRGMLNVNAEPHAPEEPSPPGRSRHWPHLTPAQQTGIIRNEYYFWEFAGVRNPVDARDFIRKWCGVASCSEIKPGTEAAGEWARLQVRYGNWLRELRGAA